MHECWISDFFFLLDVRTLGVRVDLRSLSTVGDYRNPTAVCVALNRMTVGVKIEDFGQYQKQFRSFL